MIHTRRLALHPDRPLRSSARPRRRRCSRCISTISEGAVRDGGIGAYVSWTALLRSCSGFEAYCQRYTADVRPERVAEFLLLNADFPRSVRFAVDTRRSVAASDRAGARAKRARPRRSARRPAARVARLQSDRRDHGRQSAELRPGHPPAVRAGAHGAVSDLHQLRDRSGDRVMSARHSVRSSVTRPDSPTARPSAKA